MVEYYKVFLMILEETSKLIGCNAYIQQPAAANLHRTKLYIDVMVNAAASWLQPVVMNFGVFLYQ